MAKRDSAALKGNETPVRNRHLVRISREVFQDLLRGPKRGLGVHHPLLGAQLAEQRPERFA